MGSKDKFEIFGNVFDDFTMRLLHRLSSQGYFDALESPIAIGKEANVFTALTKDGRRVIVKIYRLESCNFNKMYDYIKFDPRFLALRKQRRKVIFSWVQREYRNLMGAREAGVSVPTPLAVRNHIIVMEMIGDSAPAPKLKDAKPKDPDKFFKDIVDNMKRLHRAGYVHADLSPFNILNHNGIPYLIDMSQGTRVDNSEARDYLVRDIGNVCAFFARLGMNIDKDAVLSDIEQAG